MIWIVEEGKITQIIGAVLDVQFDKETLPSLYNAIEIPSKDGEKVIAEVMQHLGNDTVRCVAMSATDGLKRGMKAVDTGKPIQTPVGDAVLGRVFNVLGETIDGGEKTKEQEKWSIHRPAPSLVEQKPVAEMFETGIKVIDLLAPYAKGGKVGLFGGAGVGKTVYTKKTLEARALKEKVPNDW